MGLMAGVFIIGDTQSVETDDAYTAVDDQDVDDYQDAEALVTTRTGSAKNAERFCLIRRGYVKYRYRNFRSAVLA